AWNFVAISQYILGIKPDFDGLKIDPSIPHAWDGFKITRKFRGATFNIDIQNPDHIEKGIKSITVDGVKIDGNVIKDITPGVHEVVAVMG
ncbi:MAG: glycosyl transferase, partial [Oscillospiraceae bacterium]|nr:glycosyl transferase [Oscillospiraceae bacterium]